MVINRRVFLLNIIVPLLIGGGIYLISSPDVIFVQIINEHIGNTSHIIDFNSEISKVLRNYIPDILWGYSLLFTIYYIWEGSKLWNVFVAAFVFSILIESIQIFGNVPGTFDVLDIFFEGIAELIAAININNMRRRKSYEK